MKLVDFWEFFTIAESNIISKKSELLHDIGLCYHKIDCIFIKNAFDDIIINLIIKEIQKVTISPIHDFKILKFIVFIMDIIIIYILILYRILSYYQINPKKK